MPLFPETWLDSQVANLTTTGSQFDPNIIQLANGNILVSWTTDDPGGLASPDGDDILGQIFDPLGNRIGVEFIVNTFAQANNERDVDMAALPGGGITNGDSGGFLTVYERANSLTGVVEICMDQKASNGSTDAASFVVSDGLTADPNYRNPSVAVSSSTSALVVYEEVIGGVSEIRGKIYNPTTGAFGAQISLIAFAGGDTDADVAALTNGNYVITTTVGGSDRAIGYRIISSTGANVLGATKIVGTPANTEDDRDAAVTALTGGGFVISWTNTDVSDTDTLFRVYNAAGTETGSGSVGSTSATNNNNESVVTGLADGTFVIVYDNDQTSQLVIDHFSATGSTLGSFSFSGLNTTPTVTSLADGRLAVAWADSAGEMSMEILDTRDNANTSGVYTPADWQIGTVHDDVFAAASNVATVHGHTGNDTIFDNAAGGTSFFGDAGDDQINVVSGIASDAYFGGADNDTIDWSGNTSDVGAVYNLNLGTATNGFSSEVMQGFENLIGTDQNDQILGSTIANILSGLAGDDSINGGLGADTMNGGIGNDTYWINQINDVLIDAVGQGTLDRVIAASNYTLAAGVEIERLSAIAPGAFTPLTLVGNALAQTISGNAGANVLSSGAAGLSDTLRGFQGDDIYRVFNSGDLLIEAAGGGVADRVISSVNFVLAADDDVEFMATFNAGGIAALNLTGNALAQSIVGNNGLNVLSSGAAGLADTMNGLGGSDLYRVFNVGDLIVEVAGGGLSDQVNAGVSFALAADDNIEILSTNGAAGIATINLRGNALAQQVIGNAGANRLNGMAGSDVITTGTGADVIVFNTVLGPTNVDTITDYNVAADRIEIDNAVFVGLPVGVLAAAAFAANITGIAGDASDRIIYETDTGFLWFDADGAGGVGRIRFADLAGGLAMSASEFTVV